MESLLHMGVSHLKGFPLQPQSFHQLCYHNSLELVTHGGKIGSTVGLDRPLKEDCRPRKEVRMILKNQVVMGPHRGLGSPAEGLTLGLVPFLSLQSSLLLCPCLHSPLPLSSFPLLRIIFSLLESVCPLGVRDSDRHYAGSGEQ